MTSPTFRDPPRTTVVTGATGWLGRALLAALTDAASPQRRDCIRALVATRPQALPSLPHCPVCNR